MNEFELINRLRPGLPSNATTVVGAGDDCAVIDAGLPGRVLLFKTDAVVEGVHFQATAEPRTVGHKALARCLSDVAAMAGWPEHALVTIGLPRDFHVAWVEAVYAGLCDLARRHQVAIVGGETTTCPDRTFLSVALLGWAERGRCLLRSGAQPGDALFVTGELGGAVASGRHLTFEPRLEEARWLASEFHVHAMIDVSDGLAGDLRHVLVASKVGAELLAEAIPISRAARQQALAAGLPSGGMPGAESRRSPLAAALSEGEDFELLFAVAHGDAVKLLDAWKARFPAVRLTCIGKVTATAGLTLRDAQGARSPEAHGYVHFQKP